MKFIKTVAVFALFSVLCVAVSGALVNAADNPTPPISETENTENISENEIDFTDFASGKPLLTDMNVSAKSALICTEDGLLVYEKNADTPLPMASITKVMTAILALEQIEDLKQTVTVPNEAVGIEGSSVYLSSGEKVSYEMLVYSAMLESANDAVTALAILLADSEEGFVSLMNEKAAELKMTSTHFCNPHGLHENEHFTTARDYVKLMSYALKNDTFREVIATKKAVFEKSDGSMTRVLSNHNRLLNTYKGMLGGKTGFTKTSGRTLITAASRNGETLICITLDAPNDWHDHTEMLDAGFDAVKISSFTSEQISATIPVAAGDTQNVRVIAKKDIKIYSAENDIVTYKLVLPHTAFAPIKAGEEIGYVRFYINGKEVALAPLVAESAVMQTEENESKGFFARLWEQLTDRD